MNLTWQDNSFNESGFAIQRSADYGSTWTTLPINAPANTTTYTDSGLSEDQSYEYRVCATNAAGNSAYTMAAYATTPPKAPTGLSAAFVSGGEIDLTWTIHSSSAYYYSVEHSTDGGNAKGVTTDCFGKCVKPNMNDVLTISR